MHEFDENQDGFSLEALVKKYEGPRIEFYETIVDAISLLEIGIAFVDVASEKVVYCNQCYSDLMGYKRSEILGKMSASQLVAPESHLFVKRKWHERKEGLKDARRLEHWGLKKDGTKILFDGAFSMVEGTRNLMMGLLRPIDEN